MAHVLLLCLCLCAGAMPRFCRYTQYLAGYALALDTIAGLRSNSRFMSFLQNARTSSNNNNNNNNNTATTAAAAVAGAKPTSGLDLMSYLIM